MESRRAPEYNIEIIADRSSVKDVVKGVLHVIFFHRYFTPLQPSSHDVLDLTLPYCTDADIASLIDAQSTAFVRQLDISSPTSSPPQTSGRGQLVVQFLERKRRRGWFAKADEETVWENWVVDVSLLSARSETEAGRNRRAMEHSLQKATMQVVTIVNRDRTHIPPITTNDTNPFPYQILVNPKSDGMARMGIF